MSGHKGGKPRKMRAAARIADGVEGLIQSTLMFAAWKVMSEQQQDDFWNAVANKATEELRKHGAEAVRGSRD